MWLVQIVTFYKCKICMYFENSVQNKENVKYLSNIFYIDYMLK